MADATRRGTVPLAGTALLSSSQLCCHQYVLYTELKLCTAERSATYLVVRGDLFKGELRRGCCGGASTAVTDTIL
jgi:hypothetical protein